MSAAPYAGLSHDPLNHRYRFRRPLRRLFCARVRDAAIVAIRRDPARRNATRAGAVAMSAPAGAARTFWGLPVSVAVTVSLALIGAVFAYGALVADVRHIDRDNARQDAVLREIREDIREINRRLLDIHTVLKASRQ